MNTNSTADSRGTQFADWADLLGRIVLGAFFLLSGWDKIVNTANNVGYMNAYHVPMAEILIWPTVLFELVAGVMLIVGWKAHWAALALAGFTMLVALIFHNFWAVPADQVQNQMIHFMKNVAIFGGLLHVFAFGCGRYAMERR
jgi:putative oxidoreductase